MKIFCTILISTVLFSNVCSAKEFSTKNFKNIYANFGTWQEFYKQVQSSRDGDLNSFEFRPYLSAGVDYELTSEHAIISEVGYVIRENLGDSTVTKDQFFLRFDYAHRALEWLRLRAGTSFMWVTYSGDGSEQTLPNGNSTEVYFAPSERSNVFNQTLDLGLEFIKDRYSFRVQSYIYAFSEEDERLTSFSASLNYLIPIKDL